MSRVGSQRHREKKLIIDGMGFLLSSISFLGFLKVK